MIMMTMIRILMNADEDEDQKKAPHAQAWRARRVTSRRCPKAARSDAKGSQRLTSKRTLRKANGGPKGAKGNTWPKAEQRYPTDTQVKIS